MKERKEGRGKNRNFELLLELESVCMWALLLCGRDAAHSLQRFADG